MPVRVDSLFHKNNSTPSSSNSHHRTTRANLGTARKRYLLVHHFIRANTGTLENFGSQFYFHSYVLRACHDIGFPMLGGTVGCNVVPSIYPNIFSSHWFVGNLSLAGVCWTCTKWLCRLWWLSLLRRRHLVRTRRLLSEEWRCRVLRRFTARLEKGIDENRSKKDGPKNLKCFNGSRWHYDVLRHGTCST